MYFLLSRTQAGPGRTVKQEQEEISRNHLQTFSGCSVQTQASLLFSSNPFSISRLPALVKIRSSLFARVSTRASSGPGRVTQRSAALVMRLKFPRLTLGNMSKGILVSQAGKEFLRASVETVHRVTATSYRVYL